MPRQPPTAGTGGGRARSAVAVARRCAWATIKLIATYLTVGEAGPADAISAVAAPYGTWRARR
ncbi:hypothetical protein [Streptomyces yangpuensis]|uniref:hypothetical protein n=1 Tax=Streptomyces yangpuensis TaxID=1648182 RepID=UPI0036485BB1